LDEGEAAGEREGESGEGKGAESGEVGGGVRVGRGRVPRGTTVGRSVVEKTDGVGVEEGVGVEGEEGGNAGGERRAVDEYEIVGGGRRGEKGGERLEEVDVGLVAGENGGVGGVGGFDAVEDARGGGRAGQKGAGPEVGRIAAAYFQHEGGFEAEDESGDEGAVFLFESGTVFGEEEGSEFEGNVGVVLGFGSGHGEGSKGVGEEDKPTMEGTCRPDRKAACDARAMGVGASSGFALGSSGWEEG
jgi:hypothetical protein